MVGQFSKSTRTNAQEALPVANRLEQKAQSDREELVERILRAIEQDGTVEPGPGLHLYRLSKPSQPVHGVYAPAFCVIAQGSKEVLLGELSNACVPI